MKNIGKDSKAQLYWDEEKMKESERGRGQYDKIEEPKTPYCLSPSVILYSFRTPRKNYSNMIKALSKDRFKII